MAHPNERLLTDIEAFCATHGMSDAKFGRLALKDWRFVQEIRGDGREKPRRVWPETEAQARKFMVTYREPDAREHRADAA